MKEFMEAFGKIKQVQRQIEDIKERLKTLQATAESGGGMVKATVNGDKQVVSVVIDRALLDPKEQETVQDLVVAAINMALVSVSEKVAEEVKNSAVGLLGNLPLDLIL